MAIREAFPWVVLRKYLDMHFVFSLVCKCWNDGYIIKITQFESIHDTTVAAADEGIGVHREV